VSCGCRSSRLPGLGPAMMSMAHGGPSLLAIVTHGGLYTRVDYEDADKDT